MVNSKRTQSNGVKPCYPPFWNGTSTTTWSTPELWMSQSRLNRFGMVSPQILSMGLTDGSRPPSPQTVARWRYSLRNKRLPYRVRRAEPSDAPLLRPLAGPVMGGVRAPRIIARCARFNAGLSAVTRLGSVGYASVHQEDTSTVTVNA